MLEGKGEKNQLLNYGVKISRAPSRRVFIALSVGCVCGAIVLVMMSARIQVPQRIFAETIRTSDLRQFSNQMKLSDLQMHAHMRGLSTQGTKHELIQRLEEHMAAVGEDNDQAAVAAWLANHSSTASSVGVMRLPRQPKCRGKNAKAIESKLWGESWGWPENNAAPEPDSSHGRKKELFDRAYAGQAGKVKSLLMAGAQPDGYRDIMDFTALMYASENGYKEVVRLLLDKGAALDLQNQWGSSALMYASEQGHDEIVQMLLDRCKSRRFCYGKNKGGDPPVVSSNFLFDGVWKWRSCLYVCIRGGVCMYVCIYVRRYVCMYIFVYHVCVLIALLL